MRTTVTLDQDVAALLDKVMRERGLSFKQALNDAVRRGLAPPRAASGFRTPTFRLGFDPGVPLDKALRLAGELEDDELARNVAARK